MVRKKNSQGRGKVLARLAMQGILASSLSFAACQESKPSEVTVDPKNDSTNIAKADTACDGSISASTWSSTADSAGERQAFRALVRDCLDRGKNLECHSHCGGNNSCKGMSYEIGVGPYAHDCAGKATCTGVSCPDATGGA